MPAGLKRRSWSRWEAPSAEAAELQKYVEKVSGAKLEIVAENKLATSEKRRSRICRDLSGGEASRGPQEASARRICNQNGWERYLYRGAGCDRRGDAGRRHVLRRLRIPRALSGCALADAGPARRSDAQAGNHRNRLGRYPPGAAACAARNSFATARRSRQWPILVGASADWRPGEDFNRPCLCRLVGQVSRAIPGNIRDAAKRDAYQCQ